MGRHPSLPRGGSAASLAGPMVSGLPAARGDGLLRAVERWVRTRPIAVREPQNGCLSFCLFASLCN